MRSAAPAAEGSLTRVQLAALTACAGLAVANLYYIQPLLPVVGRTFSASPREVGLTPMLTQIGYGAGLFLFVPLGDVVERRRLMVVLLGVVTLALVATAFASSLAWLAIASFAVGFTTVVPHVALPLAAHLARPGERGKVVGTILSGILVGILLARTASGFLGGRLGWRAVYGFAAALMVALAATLRVLLPRSPAERTMPYPALLRSMFTLVRREPILREAAVLSALGFGAFSAFWTTLAFFLEEPPYRMGAEAAGLFGLLGATGAAAAPWVGRLADRVSARTNSAFALVLALLSFGVLAAFGRSLAALVVGVVVLDLGVQANQVSNLSRIHALDPAARSRLNTVYMVTSFTGGAVGTAVGTWAWTGWRWMGVCATGAALVGLGLVVWLAGRGSPRLAGARLAAPDR